MHKATREEDQPEAAAVKEEPECGGEYFDHADGKEHGATFDESCAMPEGGKPSKLATKPVGGGNWFARLFAGLSCSRPSPADVAEPEPPQSLPVEGPTA